MPKHSSNAEDFRTRLVGTWRMHSWKRALVPSGEQSDALGSRPFGYVNYAPDGRLMVFVLQNGRPRPKATPSTSDEKIALFDSLFAYVGTYRVESDRVIYTPDGSWNEIWIGTTQTRFLALRDDRLVCTTPETTDPMDGKLSTYLVEFERA